MGKFKIYLLTLLILLLVIGSVGGILFLKNQKTIIEKLEEFESNSPQGIVIENNS